MSQDSPGKHLCALLVARAPITGLESSQGPHCPWEKGQNPDLPSVPAPCCPISLDILMGDVPVGHPPLLPNCACCTLPHRSPEYPVLHPMPMTTSNSTLQAPVLPVIFPGASRDQKTQSPMKEATMASVLPRNSQEPATPSPCWHSSPAPRQL